MMTPTLLRIDSDYQVRCPVCNRFLPRFHHQDELLCSSCFTLFERS